jgi:hypothetical protein
MRKILKNKIQCNKCKDIIESKSVHDFRYCQCGNVFVDGGRDYTRRGWNDGEMHGPTGFTELSEYSGEE